MALYAASQFEQFGLDLRPEPEGRFVATGFALKETERDTFYTTVIQILFLFISTTLTDGPSKNVSKFIEVDGPSIHHGYSHLNCCSKKFTAHWRIFLTHNQAEQ